MMKWFTPEEFNSFYKMTPWISHRRKRDVLVMLERIRGQRMVPFWTIMRLYLGYEWITAAIEKLTKGFDATGFLKGAIKGATGDHPAVQGWYAAFLKGFALPNVGLFNIIVPCGEFLIGLGLILGTCTTVALLAGAFMNLNFLLAGTTSTNPILYTLAVLLLVAGPAAYAWGIDRFAIPWVKAHHLHDLFNHKARMTH